MRLFTSCLLFLCIHLSATQPERYALVTGASKGLGKALVEELLNKDPSLKIFAVARTQKDLEHLSEQHPSCIIPITADLTQAHDLEFIVETVHSKLSSIGTLIYLIHNAAIMEPIGELSYLQNQSLSTLASVMDRAYKTNVIAPHLLTLALLPELTKTSSSRVLFVSSVAGDQPVPGAITYSCTKAALDHLARNLRASLDDTIAIGTLHPGVIDTPMHAALRSYPVQQFILSASFRKAKENNELSSPTVAAKFIVHLLYETPKEEFSSKKWNFYFTHPKNIPDSLVKAIGSPPHYVKNPSLVNAMTFKK